MFRPQTVAKLLGSDEATSDFIEGHLRDYCVDEDVGNLIALDHLPEGLIRILDGPRVVVSAARLFAAISLVTPRTFLPYAEEPHAGPQDEGPLDEALTEDEDDDDKSRDAARMKESLKGVGISAGGGSSSVSTHVGEGGGKRRKSVQ